MKRFVMGLICGSLAIAIFTMHVMANYQDGLFRQLHDAVVQPDSTEMQRVVAITHAVHDLVKPRQELFSGFQAVGLRDEWFRSGDVLLNDGRGSCGSYTTVIAGLLELERIPYRILQLYCSDTKVWGCHITLEAEVDGQWHVIDGLSNVIFPVGAAELKRNWPKYQELVPTGYPADYDYNDYRYTNWNKIPVIMPVAKSILDWIAPDFAPTLSIRRYVMNIYRTYEIGLISVAAILALAALAIRVRGNVRITSRSRRSPVNVAILSAA